MPPHSLIPLLLSIQGEVFSKCIWKLAYTDQESVFEQIWKNLESYIKEKLDESLKDQSTEGKGLFLPVMAEALLNFLNGNLKTKVSACFCTLLIVFKLKKWTTVYRKGDRLNLGNTCSTRGESEFAALKKRKIHGRRYISTNRSLPEVVEEHSRISVRSPYHAARMLLLHLFCVFRVSRVSGHNV